ncbi:hypothetical protein AA958_19270 [Streptomyces sp. CNQ-509]|uniref:hypothetical protein n=1 Tax=Streptomyces sp. CNQ-509 TaxID=444103 RepID=UPI00062DD62D|nr:hypothetical protein [Streptomyces sp. CNQ-509]AKH83969.1 hypothetical protein AA958_19270 [Streptomyces sp. CNQ-509]
MGQQGERIFRLTAEQGFPDPWLSFGDSLCDEAALSTELTRAISTARKEPADERRAEVDRVFAAKKANLIRCAGILDQVLGDYDQSGMWDMLDARASRLDIPDVLETWAHTQALHPFPVVLKSLEFNWGYMKEHGVRAFYEMTREYISRLQENTDRWLTAWAAEVTTGEVDRITAIECDLASIEAPMHCDVCKKTITALLYLDG